MPTQRLTLPVLGMTCASCVSSIEGALNNLPGVQQARVNLTGGRAAIEFDPARVSLRQIEQAIAHVGYDVGREEILLYVTGMTCASCVQSIETAVSNLPGVEKVAVNLAGAAANVTYLPGAASPAAMKRTVRDLGYEVDERVERRAAMDREREARQREIRRQGLYLAFAVPVALLVMLGTFREYWILPQFVPEWLGYQWVLGLLTTPVVFGPGRQFFTNSWKGLKHGVTDMNLLYATGIGATFAIAVINTLFPKAGFGGEGATFFESAALLTGFIVLGRFLEALTRGRTSEAIRKLMGPQPKFARVIRHGLEIEVPADEVELDDGALARPGERIPVDGLVLEGY